MADHSTFLFWSFLFCYYPPFISASFHNSARNAEQIKALPDVYKEENSYNASHLPKPHFLHLSSNCILTLPGDVFSDLENKCPKELAEFAHTQQVITLDCTCEFMRNYTIPPNNTVCAEMLKSCGNGSVAISVGISLLLLLAICGIGCVWRWKHRITTRFTFPRLLRRSGSGRGGYSKTLASHSRVISSSCKVPVQTQNHKSVARETNLCDVYENLEVGPPKVEEAVEGLYENTRPSKSGERVCGNDASSHYYNFQKPVSPEIPEDEDTYILPD